MSGKAKQSTRRTVSENCPCGSGGLYGICCGPLIDNSESAITAEQLMRSRYTAYTKKEKSYLLKTWHPDTRPATLDFDVQQKWLGLKIKQHCDGAGSDEKGTVEFIARYKLAGKGYRLHELSRFVKRHQQWFYVDGEQS